MLSLPGHVTKLEPSNKLQDLWGSTYIVQKLSGPIIEEGILEIDIPIQDEKTKHVYILNAMAKDAPDSTNQPIILMIRRGSLSLSLHAILDKSKNPIGVFASDEFGIASLRKI